MLAVHEVTLPKGSLCLSEPTLLTPGHKEEKFSSFPQGPYPKGPRLTEKYFLPGVPWGQTAYFSRKPHRLRPTSSRPLLLADRVRRPRVSWQRYWTELAAVLNGRGRPHAHHDLDVLHGTASSSLAPAWVLSFLPGQHGHTLSKVVQLQKP